jgi:hypothetical protein
MSPDARPPAWDSWPREERINYLASYESRAALLSKVLSAAGQRHEPRIDAQRYIKKRELAAILLTLEEK